MHNVKVQGKDLKDLVISNKTTKTKHSFTVQCLTVEIALCNSREDLFSLWEWPSADIPALYVLIKAWYVHSNIKQKVRMFRNSMLGCITIAGGYGILRPGLHCKHLQRYFTQIIRLKLDINNKILDL